MAPTHTNCAYIRTLLISRLKRVHLAVPKVKRQKDSSPLQIKCEVYCFYSFECFSNLKQFLWMKCYRSGPNT